ncbi:hypothetical protein NIES2109_34060 [Nostoc sp. HK-01]|nr:hypothetical protein NIES2109_34060 [Nostoc sp. HK-01]
MKRQLTLFDLQQYEQSPPTHDPIWDEIVREQDNHDTQQASKADSAVREQVNEDTKKIAPEHTHWLEEYWVKRCGKKHKYYRYCWMTGRKINRCHICSVNLPDAGDRKLAIEAAINSGREPKEIENLIHSWRGQVL